MREAVDIFELERLEVVLNVRFEFECRLVVAVRFVLASSFVVGLLAVDCFVSATPSCLSRFCVDFDIERVVTPRLSIAC